MEESVTSATSPLTAIALQVRPGPAVNSRGHTKSVSKPLSILGFEGKLEEPGKDVPT